MTPVEAMQRAANLFVTKSQDYQNPNSRVKHADYYPRGCATILDIIQGKVLRMYSILEGIESNPNYKPNHESLEDSAIDLINYAAFFASYLSGGLVGQDKKRDLLNRELPIKKEVDWNGYVDVNDLPKGSVDINDLIEQDYAE